jgi:hypothetical protein
MLKINVVDANYKTIIEYNTVVPPVVGDLIGIDFVHYTVVKRVLSPDNQNFIIIYVETK